MFFEVRVKEVSVTSVIVKSSETGVPVVSVYSIVSVEPSILKVPSEGCPAFSPLKVQVLSELKVNEPANFASEKTPAS